MLADSFQSPLTVIMLSCKIRTPCFLAFVFVLCSSIGEISTQSIDEVISSAANSSDQFSFIQDGEDFIIKTELDILYTREQWSEMIRLNNTIGRQKRKAIRNTRYRWTNNVIPYQITGYFSQRDRGQITASLNEWNYYTCLTFRPARRGDRNQIRMQNGGGCSSYVGMRGGTQIVSLAPNCRIKRIIVHELGHAIGFQHEQTRPDRDNYVYILRQNIPGSMYFNFQRFSTGVVNSHRVPYDYTSVMHYGAYAFSVNGRRTIQTKDARYLNLIGKSPGLSFKDIKLANLMYNCAGRCGSKTCTSPGYLDKNCVCMCPGPSPGQPIRKCSGGGGGGKKDCVDKNTNCKSWAAQGECKKNPDYMLVNCKKSCNKCGGGGGGGKGDCVDKNSQCASWASKGECDKNPDYMHVNCKKSCKKCKTTKPCLDSNKHCAGWAATGECKKNPEWMSPNCKKSCNTCSSSSSGVSHDIPLEMKCIDENNQCSTWAQHGECTKNPLYMLQYCKKSCHYCNGSNYVGNDTYCNDANPSCPLWASLGECTKNPAYMAASCRESCNLCESHLEKKDLPCFDFHNSCPSWKTQQFCVSPLYKAFMTTNCPKSCGICE